MQKNKTEKEKEVCQYCRKQFKAGEFKEWSEGIYSCCNRRECSNRIEQKAIQKTTEEIIELIEKRENDYV